MLLLSLLASLFIGIAPVKADSTDLYSTEALKEYKQWNAYTPAYTFSKDSGSVLQAMSTDNGLGDAYIFMPFDRSYLDGKKLRVYWQWYYDYYGDPVTLAELYVVDHELNRRLINDDEFRTTVDNVQHPISDYNSVLACSYPATSNGGWIGWREDTSGILNLSGFSSSTVSVVIRAVDYWTADTTGLQVCRIQVLDSSNNVLKTCYFVGSVIMDQLNTYFDYGLLRTPSMTSYGTLWYPADYGGDAERTMSGAVSAYITTEFANTGKYNPCIDDWGDRNDGTYPDTVYYNTYANEIVCDYSLVIYKGHYWRNDSAGGCGTPDCDVNHWGVVDINGYATLDPITDYELFASVQAAKTVTSHTRGTHDFVFLWSCVEGDPSRAGEISGDHAWGMLASWMDITDPSSEICDDGYADPDLSDHVFICFTSLSPCYNAPGQAADKYLSQFVCYFFNRLIIGHNVMDALDAASQFVNDADFDESDLYLNQQIVWDPVNQCNATTQLRVWGDGYATIPR